VNIASPEAVILVVAALYVLAALFCFTLPSAPPPAAEKEAHHGLGVGEAERAVESTFTELREGFGFIQTHRNIAWSLSYLAIAASLVGVLGVLGPAFAQETLGLESKDVAVVVLPLGFGIVMGILLLNSYGKYFPRRRVIEGGMIVLGILLAALSAAGPISRLLQRADAPGGLDLSGVTSLLAVVVVIAFFAGIAYGLVAIPSQTQLQEDLPEDVRGRVFGVLGMLVSVASFLPIIIVGPISDTIGTTAVIFIMAITVTIIGIISVLTRGPLKETEARPAADPHMVDPLASALGADLPTWTGHDADDEGNGSDGIPAPSLATTVPPMPVGPAGDMLVPTGVEPDDGPELAGAGTGPAEETPDRGERG
jgi:MFS-type transporter involved in bile tolerance (Atg22 family)